MIIIFPIMQLLSAKVSNALDIFAIFNTKIFLGMFFVTVVSVYGILFKLLKIDLLRKGWKNDSYWLDMEKHHDSIFKQY